MIDYPDTRQMLLDGHLQMDSDSAAIAMTAFGRWLDNRREYLKENDPEGLAALWAELHVE